MTSKFAVAFVSALGLSIAIARADVPPDVQKTITNDYQLGCTAVLAPTDGNLTAGFGYLSPDYVDIDVRGKKRTRDEVVGTATMQLKQIHSTACEPTIVSQTLNADGSVTVVSQLHVVGSFQGPDSNHNVDVNAKALDTWKQVGGTWMVTQGQELHTTVKVDGKVIEDEGQ
jgi:hypothetical protein